MSRVRICTAVRLPRDAHAGNVKAMSEASATTQASETATATPIIATVENGVIKLPEGVHFPDGTKVTVEAEKLENEPPLPTLAERLAPFIGIVKDAPSDLAENHDHYLYGTPKQTKA